jgi:hypothetical protein
MMFRFNVPAPVHPIKIDTHHGLKAPFSEKSRTPMYYFDVFAGGA